MFFNDTATTEIYTLPYTTLFRSVLLGRREQLDDRQPVADGVVRGGRQHRTDLELLPPAPGPAAGEDPPGDRKSTRLNSSHANISYAVFCLKKNTKHDNIT